MKKIFRKVALVFLLVFAGLSSVLADECTYGDILKITYDESGAATITSDDEFLNSSLDNVVLDFLIRQSVDIETANPQLSLQLSDLYGLCPSKIYSCKESVFGLYITGDNFREEFENLLGAKTTKEKILGFLKLITSGVSVKKTFYLAATEGDMKELKEVETLGFESYSPGTHVWTGNDRWDELMEAVQGKSTKFEVAEKIIVSLIRDFAFPVIALPTELTIHHVVCQYIDYTGDLPTYNLACANAGEYLKSYGKVLDSFDKCNDNVGCKSSKIHELNDIEEKTKKYCGTILENYEYDKEIEGSSGIEAACIDECVNIASKMNMMKKNAGLIESELGKCGFSARLAVWVRNVVKWVKYIIPVVLIILGILDFIKAITKDKEEELKKAQSRFIKRLIASALIFIIPFILGFVLDKMGFGEYIEGCNLIEELNNYNEKD